MRGYRILKSHERETAFLGLEIEGFEGKGRDFGPSWWQVSMRKDWHPWTVWQTKMLLKGWGKIRLANGIAGVCHSSSITSAALYRTIRQVIRIRLLGQMLHRSWQSAASRQKKTKPTIFLRTFRRTYEDYATLSVKILPLLNTSLCFVKCVWRPTCFLLSRSLRNALWCETKNVCNSKNSLAISAVWK